MRSKNWFIAAGVIVFVLVLLLSLKMIGNWGSVNKGLDDGITKKDNAKEEDKELQIPEEDKKDEKKILSESVEVYVQDICITPQTLQFMAANNDFELIQMGDNSVTLEIVNDEQRIALYEELSKMGRVEETGDNIGADQVKVVIISVMDEAGGD